MQTEALLKIPALLLLAILAGYFLLLLGVSYMSSRASRQNNSTFFQSEKNSPWYVIAFGTIGGSLSGVTFVSVPAAVGGAGVNQQFAYWQLVLGYVVGYLIIAWLLLPIYYRLNLVSIYGYLEQRFDKLTYKVGAGLFLLSRSIGTAFRMYLTANILHSFVFAHLGVGFVPTVLIILLLIFIYTYSGGVNTIIWTDTVQTVFMLLSIFATVYFLCEALDIQLPSLWQTIEANDLGQIFFFENGWANPNHFLKQLLSGASVAVVMTGLDQDMMQKNLSCKSLADAQKNLYTFSAAVLVMNFVFLIVGALLTIYARQHNLGALGDKLFPTVALQYLPAVAGLFFIIGLTAAAYASTDSAITAMTTSFCVDLLGMKSDSVASQPVGKQPFADNSVLDQPTSQPSSTDRQQTTRKLVHIGIIAFVFGLIMWFWYLQNPSIINSLLTVSGYTYGPLLGLFMFGIFTRRAVKAWAVPLVCLLSPLLAYLVASHSEQWLWGYKFSFETLPLNGLLTFVGLYLFSRRG